MTANSFVTVSLSPPTVLVSVMPGRMHRAISASGRYCVNSCRSRAGIVAALRQPPGRNRRPRL